MYKSAVSETYHTPVEIKVPDGKGGSVKHKFKVEFKRQSQDELDEIHRRLNLSKLNDGEKLMTDDELLEQVLVGWQEQQLLLTTNGNPAEFSDEARSAMLNIFPVRPTLVNAFFDSIKSGARKN